MIEALVVAGALHERGLGNMGNELDESSEMILERLATTRLDKGEIVHVKKPGIRFYGLQIEGNRVVSQQEVFFMTPLRCETEVPGFFRRFFRRLFSMFR